MKYIRLFAPAALALTTAIAAPAAAQTFYPSEATRATGQTNFQSVTTTPPCVRDDFGFCADPSAPQRSEPNNSDAYYQMVNACGGRLWSDRWGQQVDARIRGSLGNGTFSAYGSPYGRFRAQQESICNSRQQMYSLAVRYGGLENVPADQLRAAERSMYIATELGPRREAERQVRGVSDGIQRRAADRVSRALGF